MLQKYDRNAPEIIKWYRNCTIIHKFKNGVIEPTKQNDAFANYLRKRTKKDGLIDWRMSTASIYNLVRALTRPYPGAEIKVDDDFIKIWAVKSYAKSLNSNIEPGKVIKLTLQGPIVKTGDGAVYITECFPKLQFKVGDYL